jgi:hypothetical protein
MNFLPGLASNRDSPDLSLPSSKGYRSEPKVPTSSPFIYSCFKYSILIQYGVRIGIQKTKYRSQFYILPARLSTQPKKTLGLIKQMYKI